MGDGLLSVPVANQWSKYEEGDHGRFSTSVHGRNISRSDGVTHAEIIPVPKSTEGQKRPRGLLGRGLS